MCTINSEAANATVCDVALSRVRAALELDPDLAVRYEATLGDGTRVILIEGDLATFETNVRMAVAQANP